MGSCVSLNRKSDRSAVKNRPPVGSVADEFEIPPSPIKHYIKDIAVISQNSPAGFATVSSAVHGSKEEAFFDSQPWFDSDCEDFFSVRGDNFTPSCGNTPIHHDFPEETPRASKACNGDRTPGFSSPAKKRKKLAELFRESFGDDEKLSDGAEVESGASEKRVGSKLCCLPPLISCRSSSERKKSC